ncbi:MAG: DNA mismatch repair protein MutS [Salinivirgaceae bacterium]|nr:DNA mismatch repair protein MutS [Salinivirgaceae bacterium]
MSQYNQIKAAHPDAILLFRVGDFYETFADDAIKTSRILNITLTKRSNGGAAEVPLAGFPYHALDTYLPKLVRAGERVAICEQMEDPKLTKTLVKREVTELVTPGVSTNDNILENRENNFLASVSFSKTDLGVAFLDISTGEFYAAEGSEDYIVKLVQSFRPKEIIYERSRKTKMQELFGFGYYIYAIDDWVFTEQAATDRLLKHFQTQSLKGFGLDKQTMAVVAAGAVLHYLDQTQHTQIGNITSLSRIVENEYVWLDRFTIRNLEIFNPLNEDGHSLIDIIDNTITPMGSRMLKRWVSLPLRNIKAINERLDVTRYFVDNELAKQQLEPQLKSVGDLERLVSKVPSGRINPREMLALKQALHAVEPIRQLCLQSGLNSLKAIGEQLNPCSSILQRIDNEICADAPIQIAKGQVINTGVNAELDELRNIAFSSKDYLLEIQQRESVNTGISSLKISYNNVFGYYIEVRNTYKDKVPADWIRKQTLANAERYITPELKEYEDKILGAEEKILALETKMFADLVFAVSEYISAIQLDASLISRLDCLMSFATTAKLHNYCQPVVDDSRTFEIVEGRHPVIETQMRPGQEYVSNNVMLNDDDQQIIIITGPNMAGKSALLRQTALIVLLAQVGSFVPAQAVHIGYINRIFTRVGASDNISVGESTFMVEMNEAASILNNIDERSLILLDELGRGTSTYDGISIAWAIVEFIHDHPKHRAKTLFATHYHELNEMQDQFARIKNFNVSVKEIDNKVLFLRKLVPGGSAHSFGIHVARMAGMPRSVVNRAEKILQSLEQLHKDDKATANSKKSPSNVNSADGMQLSFFQLDDPVLSQIRDEIRDLDINNLTPIEALNKLNDIKRITGL